MTFIERDGHAGCEPTDKPVELRDGPPAVVRPFEPIPVDELADAYADLDEAYAELSPQTQFHRFLSVMPRLNVALHRRLVDGVDGVDHVALFMVVLPDRGRESIVGLARVVRYPEQPQDADVAVTVRDAWHGRGIATLLLEELMLRRPAGVTRLRTQVSADNAASLAMLRRLGPTHVTKASGGVYEVEVDLPPVSPVAR